MEYNAVDFSNVAAAADPTTPQSFSTFTVPQLSIWLTSTIKNIPQLVLTEIENNEIDGSVAIELDKRDDWMGFGLTNIQSAKVIAGIKKCMGD